MINSLFIPELTKKGLKHIENSTLELGVAEKRILHNEIVNGWTTEKVRALSILNLSAEEGDLPALETLLTKATYANVVYLVLGCIKRIGKTNKAEYIESQLDDLRWEDTFVAHLEALVAVEYKKIFPKLLKWLSNSSTLSGRFWGKREGYGKIDDDIQEALSRLLDKHTYEILVQYILDTYNPDRHGNIMSWRHFWVLSEQVNNPEIIPLLKRETRLSAFERWTEIVVEIDTNEKTFETKASKSLNSVSLTDPRQSFLVLRKLYETITPEQAFIEVRPLIEKFRKNLQTRLASIEKGDHPDDIKAIANNDLEKFLGENRMFYRLHRKGKRGARYDEEDDDKDLEFQNLSKDLDDFSTLEKEFFSHIFKSKLEAINSFLINVIGRPYESIYENISLESGDIEQIEASLMKVVEKHENPLVRLKAIDALFRLNRGDLNKLHTEVIVLLVDARENVKASRGMTKDNDDWFVSEIIYLWAIRTLSEFAFIEDFVFIQEATNREKIITRYYHSYENFFDYEVVEELLNLTENLEDHEEKDNAFSALMALDFGWTKKILNIES